MRSFKNNILKIKRIKKKNGFFRRRKIENLREVTSKITILKLNKDFFLSKLNVEIIKKRKFQKNI